MVRTVKMIRMITLSFDDLAELYANVSTPGRLLLPIPQREIDTNTQLAIAQNPGY